MKGIELIYAERVRQTSSEGWTADHDDDHEDGVLERAAYCYLLSASGVVPEDGSPPKEWPWSREWWKPTDKLRDLTKAGALYLSAADRYHRLANPQAAKKQREAVNNCAARIDLCSQITGDPEKPRLFYWEEANDSWCPVPFEQEEIPCMFSVEQLDKGEETTLRLRRFDMTDAEFAAMPED